MKNQTRKELQDSKETLEGEISAHKQKIVDYKNDPFKHDNDGRLKNAPSKEIQEKIKAGRVTALEKQIAKQEGELAKVIERIKEVEKGAK